MKIVKIDLFVDIDKFLNMLLFFYFILRMV